MNDLLFGQGGNWLFTLLLVGILVGGLWFVSGILSRKSGNDRSHRR
jgi:hypothetical protein